MTSRKSFFARSLTRALHSETVVVEFFTEAEDSTRYLYDLTCKGKELCSVAYFPYIHMWYVLAGESIDRFRTVEEAAAFVKTLPGFKLSTHEKRIAGMVAPKVGGVNRGGAFLTSSPTVGTRWITRTECDQVIVPKLDKWLAVHETKTRTGVNA